MERKLASVQKVVSIKPIEGADNIECATVLGWHLVVKKGEFQPGDLGVYFEIDSVLPERPEFEFLRKSSWKEDIKGYRIKTVKLRGQVSQGILMPTKILAEEVHKGIIAPDTIDPAASEIIYYFYNFMIYEGQDVTELLGVRQWEDPKASIGGDVKGSFPSFIPKTDELRIQSIPGFLDRHQGVLFYVTEKLDGTSATFYLKDGVFGVCSRNLEMKEGDTVYWQIAKKYEIEDKLRKIGKNIAIQGEIVGPGIRKNKYKLTEKRFFVFNLFDIDLQQRFWSIIVLKYPLNYNLLINWSLNKVIFPNGIEFDFVPVVEPIYLLPHQDAIDKLVEMATGTSVLNPSVKREGLVFRHAGNELTDPETGKLSFEVINPEFLLEHKE